MEYKRKRGRPRKTQGHDMDPVDLLGPKAKGKRAAPGTKIPNREINPTAGKFKYTNELEYTIEDSVFGILNVRKTANGWWKNKGKMEELILSFKYGCTLEESFAMAGITRGQYEAFIEVHPNFPVVRDILMKLPTLKARRTLVDHLNDPDYALAYLERKERKEFSKSHIEINGESAEDLGVIILPVRQGPQGTQVSTIEMHGEKKRVSWEYNKDSE